MSIAEGLIYKNFNFAINRKRSDLESEITSINKALKLLVDKEDHKEARAVLNNKKKDTTFEIRELISLKDYLERLERTFRRSK